MLTRRNALVALVASLLGGCAKTVGIRPSGQFGRPTGKGLKPPHQVPACCRPLAEGKITLAQCMENPQCKANGNVCCMRTIQDLR